MALPPNFDYSRLKVVIIEDEAHTRSIIRSQLIHFGLREIAEAPNGKEGLMQVIRIRPHFVLCDVHMDTMDGLEFLKTLRALKVESVRDTPVIFLTADAQSDTVAFAKDHAINGYLVKPISAAKLKSHVDAVAEKLDLSKLDPPPLPQHHRVRGGNEPR